MAKLQCNNIEQCIWLNQLYEHTGAIYLITTNKKMWEYWYIPSIRNIACLFMKHSNSNEILIYNVNQTSTHFRWWIRGIISCPKIRTNSIIYDCYFVCIFTATLLEQLHRQLLDGYEKVRPSIYGEPIAVKVGIIPSILLELVRLGPTYLVESIPMLMLWKHNDTYWHPVIFWFQHRGFNAVSRTWLSNCTAQNAMRQLMSHAQDICFSSQRPLLITWFDLD